MKLRLLSLLAAAVSLGAVHSVSAADLPVKAPAYKAPPRVVGDMWSGGYYGGHIGGGWTDNEFFDPRGVLAPVGTSRNSNTAGILGGAQVGFNWQFRTLLLGIQGDFSLTDLESKVAAPLLASATIGNDTNWVTTLTGRAGFTWDRALIYAKGGGAWVRNKYFVIDPAVGINSRATAIRTGWVAGAGVEYSFAPDWSAFVEYDYIGLGSSNIPMFDPARGVTPLGVKQDIQMVKVGLNYRLLPWPPRPWW